MECAGVTVLALIVSPVERGDDIKFPQNSNSRCFMSCKIARIFARNSYEKQPSTHEYSQPTGVARFWASIGSAAPPTVCLAEASIFSCTSVFAVLKACLRYMSSVYYGSSHTTLSYRNPHENHFPLVV